MRTKFNARIRTRSHPNWLTNHTAWRLQEDVAHSIVTTDRGLNLKVEQAVTFVVADNTRIGELYQKLLSGLEENLRQLSFLDGPELTTVEAACSAFLNKVRSIPEVSEVWFEKQADDDATIWTLISAPPLSYDVRDAVYQAQVDVLAALTEPILGFQVINLRELPDDDFVKQLVPDAAKKVG